MRGVLFLVRSPGRVLKLAAAFLGALVYIWYTAVRAVPSVRRRKAAARGQ